MPNSRRVLSVLTVLATAGLSSSSYAGKPDKPDIDRVFSVLDAMVREFPRATIDPAAVVERVGKDPTALFDFVRDETGLVAYRGCLRGAAGVMMDRVGNSLDRALLLGKLLTIAGHHVRLAHAELSPEQAQTVTGALADSYPPRPAAGTTDDPVTVYWKAAGLDVAPLQQAMAKRAGDAERLAETARTRIETQVRALAAGVHASAPEAATSGALRDHFWIQYEAAGTWVDLDPTFRDAVPGKTVAAARDTSDPERLPAALLHEVELRVIVERWNDGRLTETPALTRTIRASEVLGVPVTFGHLQVAPAPDYTKVPTAEALGRIERWKPVVVIGTQVFDDQAVDTHGRVAKTAASAVGNSLGGALGALEGATAESKATGVFTAEWLEYVVRSPGAPPRTLRREVFDLIGPDARRAGVGKAPALDTGRTLERARALADVTHIAIWSAQMSPEAVTYLYARKTLENRTILSQVAKGQLKTVAQVQAATQSAVPPPSSANGLAVARQAWGPLGHDAYLDRPNIFASRGLIGRGKDSGVDGCDGFDIVANDVAVFAGQRDPFAVRLRQGVVDTNAEALLPKTSRCVAENTSELFAATGGADWLTLTRADPAALAKLASLPNDVRARIEADLRSGLVVAVPSRATTLAGRPAIAWWRVDPRTGTTLGIDSHGRGGDLSEEAIETAHIVWSFVSAFQCLSEIQGTLSQARQVGRFAVCIAIPALAGAGGIVGLGAATPAAAEAVRGVRQAMILMGLAAEFVALALNLQDEE